MTVNTDDLLHALRQWAKHEAKNIAADRQLWSQQPKSSDIEIAIVEQQLAHTDGRYATLSHFTAFLEGYLEEYKELHHDLP